ncbi:MAG: hypothetical protein OXG38_07430 [Chloroflexi bacterium]|nr:hypothetical protein [Chloroflexota bacterium]
MARHADPGPTGGAVVGRDGLRPATARRPSAGLRALLVVAVVAAAVGVGLWSAHGSASAQAPAASTITTELQPGWNLIGWMGPSTTPGRLFSTLPALQVVAAWDADTGRYSWARRGAAVPPALAPVTRGQALFLWLSGTEPVQWTRPASTRGMLLTLPTGSSLVGWAGLDGTPIAEAVGRFGAALTGVSTWNAETQEYERYTPGADDSAGGTVVLNHGDALWVELSDERRWWQSGTRRTEFRFAAEVTQERESELREEMDRVVAFFAERYGIEPPPFSVLIDPNLEVAGSASPGLIRIGQGLPFAHEYFHVVQYHLSELSPSAGNSPPWMTEGSATYAGAWYWREREGARNADFRWASWRSFAGLTAPLSAMEDHKTFRDTGIAGYNLGAFAVDWLVKRAAGLPADFRFAPWESGGLDRQTEYDSYVRYYRLLASARNWQEAFEGAFGIPVDDFYVEFEEHRSRITAQVPHLSDDRDAPVLVLLGEIPSELAARVRGEFDALQAFLRDRLGTGPADYTAWVAADGESAASARLIVLGEEPRPGSRACAGVDPAIGVYATLHCYDRLSGHLATTHFYAVRERLAPWLSLPSVPMGYERWGPHWLQAAAVAYMTHAGTAAVGADSLDRVRRRQAIIAAATQLRLGSMETQTGMASVPEHSGEALSFLAADWLVERAGERSLFEYYRLLPASGSWQEAFEEAFGLTVSDFYTAFEQHRDEIAPSLPHLEDDRGGPVLVLLGDIASEVAADIRADFATVQELFRERLASGPAAYTVFFAGDADSVVDAHLYVHGREPEGSACAGQGADAAFVTPSCRSLLPAHTAWLHFEDVRSRLAPVGSPSRPYWLGSGTRSYMQHAARAVVGIEALDAARMKQAAVVRGMPLALRGMETSDDFDAAERLTAEALSFLAADWLAQRAGEPAFFEYYRLLPSSDTWQDAFEGAFGITIDDFYQEFAAYRAAGFES